MTPAKTGFDPSSTSRRQGGAVSQIDPQACQRFKDQVLFPSWHARTRVLSYCALVAASPDPDDPDLRLREVEDHEQRDKIVNERLDPYSARYFPREARTERLAALIRQERSVDNVVRARTWAVVTERCGQVEDDWEAAYARWRARATRSGGTA